MYYIHQTTEVRGALTPLPTENLWIGEPGEYVAERVAQGWTLLAQYEDVGQTVLHWDFYDRQHGYERKKFEILALVQPGVETAPVGFSDEL